MCVCVKEGYGVYFPNINPAAKYIRLAESFMKYFKDLTNFDFKDIFSLLQWTWVCANSGK